MKKRLFLLAVAIGLIVQLQAQTTDTVQRRSLKAVSVKAKGEGLRRLGGAENATLAGQDVLFRAACCNLGESFVANPSVDVNYSDAAVGARQIRLLGLSGQYVQMLTEGLPMAGGALMPYLLDLVPGAWMKSISVSKGTSSVKQGFQSITGQIDVEYHKPDEEPTLQLNLYGDSRAKAEANLLGCLKLNQRLSTELLAHWEKDFMHHDENGDGWHDMPSSNQLHLQNRWKYRYGRSLVHTGVGYLYSRRRGGQMGNDEGRYRADVGFGRGEAYLKYAYLLDSEHNTNLAFTLTAYEQVLNGLFGHWDGYFGQHGTTSQLMLEHDFSEAHSLSTGFSMNYDFYNEYHSYFLRETVPGAYAQYTFKPSYRFTLMAGLRADYFHIDETLSSACIINHLSDDSQWFVTPRLHVKWIPADWLTLRLSAGKGYRPTHPLAEYHYLQASGRTLNIPHILTPEEAWNSGIVATLNLPLGDHLLKVNGEYYYTHFLHQAVVDYDSDPLAITIDDLNGLSYSHTAQVDASMEIDGEWDWMAAFRLNDVRCTYGGKLLEKPLQSRYKGLFTVGWKPMMGIWQVDLTLQLNGPGRMPTPYTLADGSPSWDDTFPAYPQLNLQLTRQFPHFSLYVGGENLTNYRQPMPIINAENPWSSTFEPTMIWGPVMGLMVYAGVRIKN